MPDDNSGRRPKDWPHAPVHRLDTRGVYIVTAATLYKQHYFRSPEKLTMLENCLLSLAKACRWQLEAWSVFSNHYHFIARHEADAGNLREMIRQLHNRTAIEVNRLDYREGRQVWFNFWDTKLTYPYSYFARLNYVNRNPEKHRLVKDAREYPWCSAAWFEREAPAAMVKTINSFKIDQVRVYDDFD